MTIFKTETKRTIQTGTHTLSNFSDLHIHRVYGKLIYLSFDNNNNNFRGWCMNARDIDELIGVLSEIRDVMKENN